LGFVGLFDHTLSVSGADVGRGRGFTLIELLLVIVVIGILASVLVPRWQSTRERAFVVTMKSDMRNLVSAEESYFYERATYTSNFSALTDFSLSRGVTITINQLTTSGWSATATHSSAHRQCFLYIGNASPVGGATVEGQVNCP
jgi:prepilin-type N-terminal cleavage/methylation domain-containing protein